MSEDLQFNYSLQDISNQEISNGNIYFVLDKRNDNYVATIKVDLESGRYTVLPIINDATSEESGLLAAADKKKLDTFNIVSDSDSNIIKIDSPTNNKVFNFLKDVLIHGSKVLTESSLNNSTANVFWIDEDDAEQYNHFEIDSSGNLQLYLKKKDLKGETGNKGDKGDKGDTGADGETGATGKNVDITEIITEYNVNLENPKPHVEAVLSPATDSDDNDNTIKKKITFKFNNLKGDKGDTPNIDFKFFSGVPQPEGTEIEPEIESGEDNQPTIYKISIPSGEKGDPGRSFEISNRYASYELLLTADENALIPLYSYAQVWNPYDLSNPYHGKVYQKQLSGLVQVGDFAITQPVFDIAISQLDANAQPTATIDNDDIENPKILLGIPKGTAADTFDMNAITANYETDNENLNPRVEVEAVPNGNLIGLNFSFINMQGPTGPQGEAGVLANINIFGEGNAITSITKDVSNENYLIANKETNFLLQDLSNIDTQIIQVNNGGTGQNDLTENGILLGNDQNAVKILQSTIGALFSNADSAMPQYGILPVSLGGTNATTAAQARTNLGATRTILKTNGTTGTKQNFKIEFENVMTPV